MKVSDVLTKDLVMDDLKSSEKRAVLQEMCAHLASRIDGLDGERLLEALLEREKLGSTGIGHGVAIPHTKLKGIDSIIVAFGRSKKGLDFHAMDNRPVHLFFLLVAPETSTAAHLKLLAAVSHLLKDNSTRKKLLSAAGSDEIYDIITVAEGKTHKGAAL
jgi:PTS system nitrogen regulatory IIA component